MVLEDVVNEEIEMKFEYEIKGIILDMQDMNEICQYYKVACTTEYILENYDVPENEVMKIAYEVSRYMYKYGLSEEDAICQVLNV